MSRKKSENTEKQEISVLDALKYLAARCDGAQSEDGVGFTKGDTDAHFVIGHYSALTHAQETEWYDRLHKYRNTQLGWAEVQKPAEFDVEKERQVMQRQQHEDKVFAKNKSITISEEGVVTIKFSYNPHMVSGVKEIPGRKWNGPEKAWDVQVSPDSLDSLYRFFEEYEFPVSDDVKTKMEKYRGGSMVVVNPNTIEFVEGLTDRVLNISFKYSPAMVGLVKTIPGRKFQPNTKTWWVTVKRDNVRFLQHFFTANTTFDVAEDVKNYVDGQVTELDNEDRQKEENFVLSSKHTSLIDLKPFKNGLELRPFQKAGVEYAVANKRVIIGDEMGLGKTVEALATVHQLNAIPAVIVSPNSLKLNWRNESFRWLDYTVSVIDSKKEKNKVKKNDWNSDIIIINYDVVDKFIEPLLALNPKVVIMDESHYLKNKKARRTRAVKQLAENAEYRIMLTGTAILNRPVELTSQLDILGKLDMFGGFWKFVNRYCGAYRTEYGLDLSGSTNAEELHNELRKICYIRRNKSQVLTELPEKQRSVVTLPISNESAYRSAESNIVAYLRNEIAEKDSFLKSIEHLSDEDKKIKTKEYHDKLATSAAQAEHLVQMNYLKQLSVEGKMEAAIEWVENFIESGEKLVLFAHHTKVVDELANHFKCPKINGAVSVEERQRAVDSFQSDPNTKLIVLNLKSGSVGLTLTAASNVAFLELGWTPSDMEQAEDRCHRIGQRNAVTAWYLLGESTIDTDIYDLIEEKRVVTNAINKGEFVEEKEIGIITELIKKFTGPEKPKQFDIHKKYESVTN